MSKNPFPKDFYWGASTASHQVEGGNHNQWTVWELGHASELARDAAKRLDWLPNWDKIRDQAEDPHNYVSGKGVDHYRLYREDFDLINKLNLNAFRFSIEWSRIEPEEGKWDMAAIKHYQTYIKELRKRGIEPFLNIWHWTNPIWFEEKGGFSKRANLHYFEEFVAKVVETLCDDVTYVITLNEITSYLTSAYITGTHPPQEKSILKGLWLYHNFITLQKRCYKILKSAKPSLQVGVAQPMTANTPARPGNYLDRLVCWGTKYFWDEWFFARSRKAHDFIGMNFYFTNYLKGAKLSNPETPLSDVGWYMEPARIYDILIRMNRRFKKPLIITESGLADAADKHRTWWLQETIKAIHKAMAEGAQVKGYFHWSLLDNFEWAYGWWPKFGLIEVDRANGMKRTIRPSAQWLAAYLGKIKK